jgi:hypothetical protein
MVYLIKSNGYQKMCDTNKNVIKMGMIIKGVYSNYVNSKSKTNSIKQIIYHTKFDLKRIILSNWKS